MRGDSFNFRPAEVRQVLRLSHALHELGADPLARRRGLVEGLCRLLPADAGVCVVSHHDGGGAASVAPATTVSVVRYGMTTTTPAPSRRATAPPPSPSGSARGATAAPAPPNLPGRTYHPKPHA